MPTTGRHVTARVVVTHQDDSTTTMGSELQELNITLQLGAKLSHFDCVIENDSGEFTSTYQVDDQVDIYIDLQKYESPRSWVEKHVFSGFVEKVELKRERRSYKYSTLRITGTELAVQMLDRMIQGKYYNQKVSAILEDLVDQTDSEGRRILQNITKGTVADTPNTILPSFIFNYSTMMDLATLLTQIPREGEMTFYVTPEGQLNFIFKGQGDPVYTFTSSEIEELSWSEDVTKRKEGAYIIGGRDFTEDLSATDVDASVTLHDYHYAQQITPTQMEMARIKFYVEQIGTPTDHLTGAIVFNNSGDPGAEIVTFKVDIGETASAGWVTIDLPDETVVTPYVACWIRFDKLTGGDASNTWKIYGTASGANVVRSSDGVTWSAHTFTIGHYTYYYRQIITYTTAPGVSRIRDMIETDERIKDQATARYTAIGMVNKFNKEFHEINITCVPPLSPVLQVGDVVRINDSDSGLDATANYTVEEITWHISPHLGQYTYEVKCSASEPVEEVQDILKRHEDRIWQEKLRNLGVKEGQTIARPWPFTEDLVITEALQKYQPEDFGAFPEPLTIASDRDLWYTLTGIDRVAYSNDGTVYGASWSSSGKFIQTLDFDGTDDYVACATDTNLDVTSNTLTVDAWIKREMSGTGVTFPLTFPMDFTSTSYPDETVVAKVNGDDTSGYSLRLASDNVVFDKCGRATLTSTGSVTDSDWHHICGVADSTGMYMYIDGSLDSSNSNAESFISTSSGLDVGRRNVTGVESYFDGKLDEVKVYSRGLSGNEVWRNYSGMIAKSGMELWYRFDEGSGSSVEDQSCSFVGFSEVC